jgi:hypothetical protein
MMTRRSFLAGILASSGLMLSGAGILPAARAKSAWENAEADPIADIRAAVKAIHDAPGDGSGEIWISRETARAVLRDLEGMDPDPVFYQLEQSPREMERLFRGLVDDES